MAAVFGAILSNFEIIISLIVSIIGGVIAFLIALWYWGLDRKTERYDDDLRSDIQHDAAFSGIRMAAQQEFIATSNSVPSRANSLLKKVLRRPLKKPSKIVLVDTDSYEQRKIEMIRERVRRIPGRNILDPDLVGALRNHYAYKLALNTDGVKSETVEHFKTNLQEYDNAKKVIKLSESDNYRDITLIPPDNTDLTKDPLNDVFLRLVALAEKYCVQQQSGPDAKHQEIERCREILMPAFFGLWANHVVGIEIHQDLSEEGCLSVYRGDIRDSDNWGYWMLPDRPCDDDEFERMRHIAWSINRIIKHHWDDPYNSLYPEGESLREMNQVQEPFAIFQKEEYVVRGGASDG